jgi:hypothetical protein
LDAVPNIFKPTSEAELQRGRSYSASGSVNQHALAARNFAMRSTNWYAVV